MNPSSTGLLEDNRTVDQKSRDYLHSEVFGVSPVTYHQNQQDAMSFVGKFPLENQLQENSCVAHNRALVLAIYRTVKRQLSYIQPSPAFIYRLRSNSGQPGMIPSNADSITHTFGVPSYADFPTLSTDAELDATVISQAVYAEALKNTADQWVTIDDPSNIDLIAFAVNSLGVAASILIYSTLEEWSMETPQVLIHNLSPQDPSAIVRHCITPLPNSAYIGSDGKKYLIIQDSAFFGNLKFRYVSEDFIKARCYGAEYMISLKTATGENPMKYQFNDNLGVGSSGPDVSALQSILQTFGFFPSIVDGHPFLPTGYFGGLTRNAVIAFQNAYAQHILTPQGLTQGTGLVGPSTREFLNSLLV